jgi:hypothetical protein
VRVHAGGRQPGVWRCVVIAARVVVAERRGVVVAEIIVISAVIIIGSSAVIIIGSRDSAITAADHASEAKEQGEKEDSGEIRPARGGVWVRHQDMG